MKMASPTLKIKYVPPPSKEEVKGPLLNPAALPALLAVGDLLLPLSLLVNPFPPPNPKLLLPFPAPKRRAAVERTPPTVLELPLLADDD